MFGLLKNKNKVTDLCVNTPQNLLPHTSLAVLIAKYILAPIPHFSLGNPNQSPLFKGQACTPIFS